MAVGNKEIMSNYLSVRAESS